MNYPGQSRGVKRAIGALSPAPSAYTEDVLFSFPGGSAELNCTYERNGSMFSGGIHFTRAIAFRFRDEMHCTPWHVEDAYDVLVEVDGSDWIKELVGAEPGDAGLEGLSLRHFLIYVDSAGAYEIAAEDCNWIPETAL